MSAPKDGGPAFPHSSQPLNAQGSPMCESYTEWGMSLRDWFAGQAMAGMLANSTGDYPMNDAKLSQWAYATADAMLAAREATK